MAMTPEQLLADQWAFYKANYAVEEQDLLDSVKAGIPMDYELEQASSDAGQAFGKNQGIATREQSRYGIAAADAGTQAELDTQTDLIRRAAEAGARNTIRRSTPDTNLQRLTAAIQLGQGIPAQAIDSSLYTSGIAATSKLNKFADKQGISNTINGAIGGAANALAGNTGAATVTSNVFKPLANVFSGSWGGI